MKLNNIIQNLIKNRDATINVPTSNQDLKIYKNPILDHNKWNENGKGKIYTDVGHV